MPIKLTLPEDQKLIAYILVRFIEGELTGIAEGQALMHAPTLEAADFLARQVREEIRHARMYAALYRYAEPEAKLPRSPWLLRKILAPLPGRLWYEHCFLDKAVGERWVLLLMEYLIEHTADRRICQTLAAIAKDERQHVAFGESATRDFSARSWFHRHYLWGLYLRFELALALVYPLLRRRVCRLSKKGELLLSDFFERSRNKLHHEIAELLGVAPRRSWFWLVAAQLVLWLRLPFAGWWRSPQSDLCRRTHAARI
ncbi:MAG: ferritin-like domain-containing protein [Turneriella sp.]|nr:ferritin-like domain-containing protein [Leptospiraceae bacterium]MCX7631800.1 ferritin-like domain-containing protein [Turneriella sp.]